MTHHAIANDHDGTPGRHTFTLHRYSTTRASVLIALRKAVPNVSGALVRAREALVESRLITPKTV
jgi:hypothetical protein